MDADTSEKIRDVISFVHSKTLSIGVYSPGDISVTSMYEEAVSDLAEIIQQEIAKARLDEARVLVKMCHENGPYIGARQLTYTDFLLAVDKREAELYQTLKEHKEQ